MKLLHDLFGLLQFLHLLLLLLQDRRDWAQAERHQPLLMTLQIFRNPLALYPQQLLLLLPLPVVHLQHCGCAGELLFHYFHAVVDGL